MGIKKWVYRWKVSDAADLYRYGTRYYLFLGIAGSILFIIGFTLWDLLFIAMGFSMLMWYIICVEYTRTIKELGIFKEFVASWNKVNLSDLNRKLKGIEKKKLAKINKGFAAFHKKGREKARP